VLRTPRPERRYAVPAVVGGCRVLRVCAVKHRRWPAGGTRAAVSRCLAPVGCCAPARSTPVCPSRLPSTRTPVEPGSGPGQGGAPDRTNNLDRGPGSGSAPPGSMVGGMDRPTPPEHPGRFPTSPSRSRRPLPEACGSDRPTHDGGRPPWRSSRPLPAQLCSGTARIGGRALSFPQLSATVVNPTW
jgi:hypothetical protein